MSKEEIIELFQTLSFYDDFVENYESRDCGWYYCPVYEFLSDHSVDEWIDEAFSWESSAEGNEYWDDINLVWNDFCENDYDIKRIEGYLPKKEEDREIPESFHITLQKKNTISLNFEV